MEEQEIRNLVQQATAEAVKQTLIALGLTPGDPQEMQRDMHHLRNLRRGSEAIKKHTLFLGYTAVFSGVVYIISEAAKAWLRSKGVNL
jgi:hypothetical protein